MKRNFGTILGRIVNGGTTLTTVEHALLEALVAILPTSLRTQVEVQFEAYNLVQREVDGRALNFYRKIYGKVDVAGLPLIGMHCEEAPLARLTARIEGEVEPYHATLTAVSGRAFCVAFNRALPAKGSVSIVETKEAWRSNFHVEKSA